MDNLYNPGTVWRLYPSEGHGVRRKDRETPIAHEIEGVGVAGGFATMLCLGVRVDPAVSRRQNVLLRAGRRSLRMIVPGCVGIGADNMSKDQRHGYQGCDQSRWKASLLAHHHPIRLARISGGCIAASWRGEGHVISDFLHRQRCRRPSATVQASSMS